MMKSWKICKVNFIFQDSLKDKSIDEITTEDLDNIITPEHKESVRKLREILDD